MVTRSRVQAKRREFLLSSIPNRRRPRWTGPKPVCYSLARPAAYGNGRRGALIPSEQQLHGTTYIQADRDAGSGAGHAGLCRRRREAGPEHRDCGLILPGQRRESPPPCQRAWQPDHSSQAACRRRDRRGNRDGHRGPGGSVRQVRVWGHIRRQRDRHPAQGQASVGFGADGERHRRCRQRCGGRRPVGGGNSGIRHTERGGLRPHGSERHGRGAWRRGRAGAGSGWGRGARLRRADDVRRRDSSRQPGRARVGVAQVGWRDGRHEGGRGGGRD